MKQMNKKVIGLKPVPLALILSIGAAAACAFAVRRHKR